MAAGEVAPALEARLRPIAVGAADVDRAELAENEEDFVEMVGDGIVRVDQQGDIVFLFDQVARASTISPPV